MSNIDGSLLDPRWKATDENQLSVQFLNLIRLSPISHFAFLDMIRERQGCCEFPKIVPSTLLGRRTRIVTQEGTIAEMKGQLVSVVITCEPWSTTTSATATEAARIHDGIIYYNDGEESLILIIEVKKDPGPPPDAELRREMRPNLPATTVITVNPHVVSLVWRNVIARLDGLSKAEVVHGPERRLLRDFREFVRHNFGWLNPYSTIHACGGAVDALLVRCSDILELIAPGRVQTDPSNVPYIRLAEGYVGNIYLIPEPLDRAGEKIVERIALISYPALTVAQARPFYLSDGVDPGKFLGLVQMGWKVQPYLSFRFRGGVKSEVDVKCDGRTYFDFWRAHPEFVAGRKNRELVVGEWWDRWAEAGIVRSEDRSKILAAFNDKMTVDICPGWTVAYSWSLPAAERLDDQASIAPDDATRFVGEVRQKILESFESMDQDFNAGSDVPVAAYE